MLTAYLSDCLAGDIKVLSWHDPIKQYEYWDSVFKDKGNSGIQDIFKNFLDRSIHLHHPHCLGHQVVPPLPAAALTELMSAFSNNSMAIYEVGPASTAMEKVVIEWLTGKLGWNRSKSGGVVVSGGSIGNLTALLAARKHHQITTMNKGKQKKPAIMISSQTHYSIDRAAKIMGLEDNQIIRLPVNKNFIIDMDVLPAIFQKFSNNGYEIIALSANACSTATGKYDPINQLADFCHDNNIWLHIDAAHGGPAILSNKHKHFLQGIEKADSVAYDFHKMMLMPALTTAVLFSDNRHSFQTFSQEASYLLNDDTRQYDIAGRTIECTKKPMALKVYLALKVYGQELFASYVESTYQVAHEFTGLIEQNINLELAVEPDSNIVCFRYVSNGYDDNHLNELNNYIREEIKKEGKYYIVLARLNAKAYLRMTIMNPFTNLNVLKGLIAEVEKKASAYFLSC